mgnify:CR=1 FL=1
MDPRKVVLCIALGLGMNMTVYAEDAHNAHNKKASTAQPENASLTDGEVRRVDKEGGKVTIKHGPIANLGRPAMTMVFRVKQPSMLDRVKDGDKINFSRPTK